MGLSGLTQRLRTQADMETPERSRPTSSVSAIMLVLKEQSPAPEGWKKYSSTPASASAPAYAPAVRLSSAHKYLHGRHFC